MSDGASSEPGSLKKSNSNELLQRPGQLTIQNRSVTESVIPSKVKVNDSDTMEIDVNTENGN